MGTPEHAQHGDIGHDGSQHKGSRRLRRRVHTAGLLLPLLALLLPVTAPGSQALSGAAPAGADPARATGFAIDTTDRAAVAKAFRTRLRPNLSVTSAWDGSLARCQAGTTSAKAQRATVESVNFARALNGLSPVAWSAALSGRAQQAALIMAANDSLTHLPPEGSKCWSKMGSDAAARSNLSLDYPRLTAGGAVMQYLDDWGTANTTVGHRRWLLFPFAQAFGNALTETSNAMFVVGPMDTSNPNPAWVTWPSAGWFPSQAEPDGRWSLSSGNQYANFRSARIRVTHNGRPLRVKSYSVHDGYAMPTLVWEVAGLKKTGKYVVTVTGIKGGAAPTVRYQVNLFAA